MDFLEARILDLGPSSRGSVYGDEVRSTGSLELFKGALIVIVRLWAVVRVWVFKVRKRYEDGSSLGGCLEPERTEEVEGRLCVSQSVLAAAHPVLAKWGFALPLENNTAQNIGEERRPEFHRQVRQPTPLPA